MAMLTGSRQWVVVLAGGDGRRLAAATMDSDGNHVPKQFCRFGSDASVLSHTLERARRLAGPERIVAVVQEAHRRWWQDELRALPRSNIIPQRANRGTAVALLQALDTIVARDRDAQLLVLPSDQEVADEHAWHTTLRRVVDAALAAPEHVVLVGVEPQPDPDYGWILPGELVGQHARTVLGFAEKPGAAAAAELAVRGGLCSAFVFAASAMALLDLFSRHPAMPIARRAQALSGSVLDPGVSLAVAEDLPYSDFSHDLLERAPYCARVVPGIPCGWTDLGTPARLARWQRQRPRPLPAASDKRHRPSIAGAA
jgi:mannose-1-phosphate guanylyltransferase